MWGINPRLILLSTLTPSALASIPNKNRTQTEDPLKEKSPACLQLPPMAWFVCFSLHGFAVKIRKLSEWCSWFNWICTPTPCTILKQNLQKNTGLSFQMRNMLMLIIFFIFKLNLWTNISTKRGRFLQINYFTVFDFKAEEKKKE